ncbi:hypothetical protein MRX96_036829 [Rhipicephalus microplus]
MRGGAPSAAGRHVLRTTGCNFEHREVYSPAKRSHRCPAERLTPQQNRGATPNFGEDAIFKRYDDDDVLTDGVNPCGMMPLGWLAPTH